MNRGRFEPLPGPFSAERRTPMRSGTLPDTARRTAAAILRAGVRNLTDRYHVNHLNSRNPFTGRRIAELGRSVYGGAEVGF